jgi:hypothetical protein
MNENELLSFSFMLNNKKANEDELKMINNKLLKWKLEDIFPSKKNC